jgi:hypothetical protein
MFDTDRWRELALDFVFGDIHFTKDAGETDYQLDNCQYEFYEDGDIPAIPVLILGLIDAGAALKPFAEFDDGRAPESLPITAGSSLARKQLTIGDCRRAKAAMLKLPGDV